ncbi:multidrug ABC transporter permease [Vibrio sp. HA2012]|uniref:ABC transporter permease n=1 Tax=Vibrio sp. HA2012 TaxID=1971595 RepID=UPI000C2C8990|nr:ABC transporter permease [Vibrio sp. HA2012]PJC87918.1 multidrug ABC transporter permease [Vibrio sp. HA2012]
MQNIKPNQWHVLANDKWLLSSLTWLPVLLGFILWWIFSQGLIRDLPVGIVDLEKSPLSQTLVRELDATSVMQADRYYVSVPEAKTALVAGEIYAYVVIPRHFERDVYLNTPPRISVFYNSQYILIGKLINSAVNLAAGTFSAQAGIQKQLSKGKMSILSAQGKTVTVRNQITPLFNLNSNYAQFLVSAIIPALWQIFIVVTTILFLSANDRIYGLVAMFGARPVRRLISLCACYLPVYLLLGYIFLLWFSLGLKWPLAGSLLPLLYAQFLTAIAAMIMGCLFFFLTWDPARAMSFSAVFTAPSFAFMGVTFPATDMPFLAQVWRSFLPVSYYIEAQIEQFSYGVAPWQTILRFTPPILGYLLPFFLMVLLIRKHLKYQEIQHESD